MTLMSLSVKLPLSRSSEKSNSRVAVRSEPSIYESVVVRVRVGRMVSKVTPVSRSTTVVKLLPARSVILP